jgi:hypothetical protein
VRYLLFALAGMTVSGHCLLMCGPFSAALRAPGRGPWRAAVLQLLYHCGKTSTYVFLGVLAAAAGSGLSAYQRPFGIVAGALVVLAGLAMLVPPAAASRLGRLVQGAGLCEAVAGLLRDPRPLSALSVGMFNGFLPCGLVYAMLAHVATLGSLPAAALGMACFGLGTLPALGLLGLSSQFARGLTGRGAARPLLARWSGLAIVGLGALALWRSLGASPAHTHVLQSLPGP